MNQKEAKNALTALPLIRHIAEHGTSDLEFLDVNGNWGPATGSWLLNEPDKYRIKPKPVTRPWSKPEDVPGPVCWIRGMRGSGINDVQRLVMCVHEYSVTHAPGGAGHITNFKELAEQWEYSTDRKTWHPCTVTEESK